MIRRHASTIGLALLLLFTTYTTLRADPATAHATVSACFVPQEHCEGEIIAAIRGAKQTIRVQAYGFTSPPILGVLAAAKRRGVDVQVILDKSAEQARYTGATYASNAGIPVWIDWRPAIAHSKVIIVDGDLVVTGSFNFTKSA